MKLDIIAIRSRKPRHMHKLNRRARVRQLAKLARSSGFAPLLNMPVDLAIDEFISFAGFDVPALIEGGR